MSIFVDGTRIWSVVARRDGEPDAGGGWLLRWPTVLRPYLSGEAQFAVRRADNGAELYRESVTLGNEKKRIRVVSAHGGPLAIDKGGHLTHMFGTTDPSRKVAVAQAIGRALDTMHELNVTAFVAFGALLGAVRDGRLIAHDNDGDIAYLARSSDPFDIMLESFELQREFAARGWAIKRMSGADFKLRAPMPTGSSVGIDVFTGFHRGGEFFLMPNVRGALPREALLPTTTIELEGQQLAAPAQPAALLEVTYGESWRVPDPAFKYDPPRATRRLLSGWFRGERRHQNYWDDFYLVRAEDVSSEPSAFARWVADREHDRGGGLVDVGCGTGRDSLWFASQGFTTLGLDYSVRGVAFAVEQAKRRGLDAEFQALNLYDLRHALVAGAKLARDRETDIVYARFLVHAMEDTGRRNLWMLSRSALRKRLGRLYVEFRTEATEHAFGEHYRQFVQPDVVIHELESYGFSIEHCENRNGLAVHNTEDPRVCRIIAKMR
ncbi:MAG: class I SAM-dependent methyltransferase [Nocardioidaceae bacterium]